MSMTEQNSDLTVRKGTPEPRGATPDGKGINFSVFSAHAEKIELCLYDDSGKNEIRRIELTEKTGDVFHASIEGLKPGQVYGYRAHGPNAPQDGHRFDPEKLLLDPYAKEISPPQDAGDVPKSRVIDTSFDWRGAKKPQTPWEKTVIYEAHPKGLTKKHTDIATDKRGVYAGNAAPEMIAHYKKLGITAVELLPVHAHADETHLKKTGKSNYWGYNTIGFFAPEPSYASAPQNALKEFKETVRELHKHGIEVILDVVYNHTGEEGTDGPTLFLRGLDNKSYYKLHPHDQSRYDDMTGCGNTVDVTHPETRKMILDSLRYWAEECGVDGFRFDLAPVLGRGPNGYEKAAPLFEDIAKDPVLSKTKMIAEPWDVGMGGYQLGNFPTGWKEWNDKFRDSVRAFWRGDDHTGGDFAHAMTGSSRIFDHSGKSPQDSINFITAHDGFTLEDVVSYNDKHNHANGEGNRDGHSNNYSYNHGHEGKTDDAAITALRERQKRNMLASLFLAQGTPMLLAGDETGNSQNGNNNAYCQDNETGWVNREKHTKKDSTLQQFVQNLGDIRKKHPVLNTEYFMRGNRFSKDGAPDLKWIKQDGRQMNDPDWHNAKTFGMMLNEEAVPDHKRKRPDRLLVLFNTAAQDKDFKLPKLPDGRVWLRILDTDKPELTEGTDKKSYTACRMKGKSLAVFKAA